MRSGLKIAASVVAAFALCALGLQAQPAPAPAAIPDSALPDPLGIRDSLARMEQQHREAYQAAKYPDAIAAARNGLALAERSGTLADQLPFLRHLAYDYWLMGDNDSAVEYSQRVLECAETLDDNRARAQGHRYLSQIYDTLDDELRLRQHAESALKFADLAGDAQVRIFALNAVGLSESRAKNYDSALRKFEECRVFWLKQNSPWNANNSLANIADVADARGDLAGALKTYEEILAVRGELKDRRGQVRAASAIASLLRRLDRADEALARLTATRTLAETVGGHRILTEFYSNLAQVHEARRDFAAALATERLAATERQQLTSERARFRATELEARLELLQKQQAIDQLRSKVAVHEARLRMAAADLAQVRAFRIAIVDGVVALTVVCLSAWLVLRYRARNRRLHASLAGDIKPAPLPPARPTSNEAPDSSCAG